MRAADVNRVDGERCARLPEVADDLALLTLALRSRAQRCGLGRQVVERITECAAPAGRKRPGRIGLDA
jgi:GNAT superfamily N-acetyltransferase